MACFNITGASLSSIADAKRTTYADCRVTSCDEAAEGTRSTAKSNAMKVERDANCMELPPEFWSM
jgi:hypothetical protein